MHSQRRWKFPTINLVDEIAEELSKVSERNFTLRTKSVRLMIFSSRRDLTIWTSFILFLLFFKGRNFKTAQKIVDLQKYCCNPKICKKKINHVEYWNLMTQHFSAYDLISRPRRYIMINISPLCTFVRKSNNYLSFIKHKNSSFWSD